MNLVPWSAAVAMLVLTGCGTASYDYTRDPSATRPFGEAGPWDDEPHPASLIDVEFGDGFSDPVVTRNLPRDAVKAVTQPKNAENPP